MKRTKGIMALVLALLMVLGMSSMSVFAAKNDSITINNAKPGETYNLYKMFDLSVNSEETPTAYTYTVNSDWAAFFAEGAPGRSYVTINAAGAVTEISDPAALAKAAAEWSGKPATPVQSVTVGEGETTATFTGLPDGYWLITSTLGTIAMADTTPDSSAVTINEKNPVDTIEKKVKEGENYGASNDAQIGDTVEFESIVKIVKGTRNVVVHDKMDSGLTYTAGSVVIDGLVKGTDYTVNESPSDGDTFDISFSQSFIDNLDYGETGHKDFTVKYTATINEGAVVKDDSGVAIVDQYNKTHVTFGDGTSSAESSTTTTTHKFAVFKHATGSTENLADAVFSLKRDGAVIKLIKLDDNNYRVAMPDETGVETFTTVSGGDIVIWGVDQADYTLLEVDAPEGYNPLTEEVSVDVNADNSTRADVENKFGNELPSTGGIGTVIFYVVGAALLIGCGVVLISRRRVSGK